MTRHFTTAMMAALTLSVATPALAHDPGAAGKKAHPGFEAIDTNKDGDMSLAELKAALATHPKMLARADEKFKHLDANGDGKITKAEFQARRKHPGKAKGHGDHKGHSHDHGEHQGDHKGHNH
jgi:hypothetical protein